MPQIAQLAETYSSQIFWLLVFFGITFFFIGRGMVPKVMSTVQLRDTQISGDLAAAQAARDAADSQEAAWRRSEADNRLAAQAVIADAKAKAATSTEATLATAQIKFNAQLAEAEAQITAARISAMAEIESIAAEATQDIVARVSGTKIDKRTARSAVQKAMTSA